MHHAPIPGACKVTRAEAAIQIDFQTRSRPSVETDVEAKMDAVAILHEVVAPFYLQRPFTVRRTPHIAGCRLARFLSCSLPMMRAQ